jgi:hypothetical protein
MSTARSGASAGRPSLQSSARFFPGISRPRSFHLEVVFLHQRCEQGSGRGALKEAHSGSTGFSVRTNGVGGLSVDLQGHRERGESAAIGWRVHVNAGRAARRSGQIRPNGRSWDGGFGRHDAGTLRLDDRLLGRRTGHGGSDPRPARGHFSIGRPRGCLLRTMNLLRVIGYEISCVADDCRPSRV